tara:strand:- start:2960 stop:3235 length:276 start_codon:yes stop_codon:yes gene_type:complete
MYYIYSFVISFILFIVLTQIDKKSKKQDDTFGNIVTFMVLYIVVTFVTFFLYNAFQDGTNVIEKSLPAFDNNILKSIPDTEQIETGFGWNF